MSGWLTRQYGDCEYHLSTVAGGHVLGHVTRNDADQWVAFTGDVHRGTVIGSGYETLHKAKMAVIRQQEKQ